jgi:hypothetical protein
VLKLERHGKSRFWLRPIGRVVATLAGIGAHARPRGFQIGDSRFEKGFQIGDSRLEKGLEIADSRFEKFSSPNGGVKPPLHQINLSTTG